MLKTCKLALIFCLCCLLVACSSEQTLPTEPILTTSTQAPLQIATATQVPLPTISASPTPEPSDLPVTSEDLAGITLRFWHPWSGEKEFATLSLLNRFNASNPYGITVVALGQGGDLYSNLRASLGTPAMPQVVMAYSNQITSWDYYGGGVVDLQPFIQDPVWGFNLAEQTDFYPEFWEVLDAGQKRLGLPAYRSVLVLFYNASWAQQLGFDSAPTTTTEFAQQACAAAATRADGRGGWIASSDVSTSLSWLFAFGGGVLDPTEQTYQVDTSANAAALQFLRDLFDQGCAWLPTERYPNAAFAARQGLFYASSIAGLPYQQSAFAETGSRDEWQLLPFPSQAGEPVLDVYGGDYAVLALSPAEQLAAWLFIKWMVEPENQAVWILGSDYLPTRAATLDYLADYRAANPRWETAIPLIPNSQLEPSLGSWGIARYALSDAIEELFAPAFSAEQIPDLLARLEVLMAEAHLYNR